MFQNETAHLSTDTVIFFSFRLILKAPHFILNSAWNEIIINNERKNINLVETSYVITLGVFPVIGLCALEIANAFKG